MVFRKRKTRATSALVPKKPKVDRKKDLESAKEISRMGYIRKLMAERFVTSETGITIEELLERIERFHAYYKIFHVADSCGLRTDYVRKPFNIAYDFRYVHDYIIYWKSTI